MTADTSEDLRRQERFERLAAFARRVSPRPLVIERDEAHGYRAAWTMEAGKFVLTVERGSMHGERGARTRFLAADPADAAELEWAYERSRKGHKEIAEIAAASALARLDAGKRAEDFESHGVTFRLTKHAGLYRASVLVGERVAASDGDLGARAAKDRYASFVTYTRLSGDSALKEHRELKPEEYAHVVAAASEARRGVSSPSILAGKTALRTIAGARRAVEDAPRSPVGILLPGYDDALKRVSAMSDGSMVTECFSPAHDVVTRFWRERDRYTIRVTRSSGKLFEASCADVETAARQLAEGRAIADQERASRERVIPNLHVLGRCNVDLSAQSDAKKRAGGRSS